MSYDMMFWFEPTAITNSVASSRCDKIIDGITGVVIPSPKLDIFADALLERYPNNLESSPWTAPVDRTAEWIQVCISWPRSREGVVGELLDLAREHCVTAYDLQSGVVHNPDRQ